MEKIETVYVESQKEERGIKMTNETIEEIEEVTIEMLDKDFEDPKLSEIQEIEIEKMGEKIKELRVEEVLLENDARFFMLGSNFEEVAKRTYLSGFELNLDNAILRISGNDDELYYMTVADLSKLSYDIKYFISKVLERDGALPKFEKVELDFIIEKLDFRDLSYYDIYLVEISRNKSK